MTPRSPNELPSPPDAPPRALALVGLSVCEAAGRLHIWSPTLLVLSFLAVLLSPQNTGLAFPLLLLCLMAAACHAGFAWRLAFDRQIFAAWAQLPDDECPQAQHAFDLALEQLLKKSAPAAHDRPMSSRVMGTRRLHLLQIAALSGQVLAFLILLGNLWWTGNHV